MSSYRTAVIVSRTRGNVVCDRAELADNPWTRFRGLLGRNELPAGEGMLLTPSPSIHSAFMRFEFDAVFLDREMRVLKLCERIPKWRARSCRGARSVLELAAGEIEKRGVEVGDQLGFAPDAPADTAPDAPGDTAPDAPGDTAPDAPGDTAPDAPGDTAPEAPGD